MKCKYCNGTGYVKTISVGGVPCSACNGTGEYKPFDTDVELDKLYPPEQTNEEWFCQLPTEEKAKVIVDLGRKQRFPKDVEVEFCEQWLKEEHKDA